MAATLTIATVNADRVHLVLSNPDGTNVGKVIRTDVNGTHTVRTQAGELPGTAANLDLFDYEFALTGTVSYAAYSVANVVIASASVDIGGTAMTGLTYRGPWPETRTNLLPNPSFEANTSGWGSARAAIARTTPAAPFTGTGVVQVTNDASTSTHYLISSYLPAPAAGGPVTFSGYARLLSGTAAGYYAQVIFYDAANGGVGPAINGTPAALVAGTWTRLAVTATVPAGAVNVRFVITSPAGVAGAVWEADGMLAEASSVLAPYIDTTGYASYAVDDSVTYAGRSYRCVTAHTAAAAPTPNADPRWAVLPTLTVPAFEHVLILACPLYPTNGVTLAPGGTLTDVTFAVSWNSNRAGRTTLHDVIGRPDPVPVLHPAATRAGDITLISPDHATCEQIEAQLSLPQVFQLRQSDVPGLDAYVVVTGLGASNVPDYRRWQLVAGIAEVAWPVGSFVPSSVWTYADLLAAGYGDYNAVAASFASYATLLDRVPIP
jgi:hypothetical protein